MNKLILIFLPFIGFSQNQNDVIRYYINEFKKNPQSLYTDLSRDYSYDGHVLILPKISNKQYELLYEYIINSEVSDWHISWRGVNLYFNGRCILGDCVWGKSVHFDEDLSIKSEFVDSINRNLKEIYTKRAEKYRGIINERFLVEGSSPPMYFEDKSYKYLIDYNYQKNEYKLGVWNIEDDFLNDPIMINYNGRSKQDGQLGGYTINFYNIGIYKPNNITFIKFYDGSSMFDDEPYILTIWEEEVKDMDFSFLESKDARITKLIKIPNYF